MAVRPLTVSVEIEPTASDLMAGLYEIRGLLRVRDEALQLELHASNFLSRGTGTETYTVPLDAVRSIETRNYLITGRLIIYPASLRAFSDLPGSSAEKLVLKVPRRDLHLLDEIARAIEQAPARPETATALEHQGLPSFPFEVPSVHAGLSRAVGHLTLDDDYLVFDVQLIALHLFKHDPEQIRVERSVIRKARLRHGFRHDRLYFKSSQFELLAAMPGTHREELCLHVPSAHRAAAEQLVEYVRRQNS